MNTLYKVLRAVITPFMKLFFPYKVYGAENIPLTGGIVLCCNHVSLSDVFYLVVVCPRQINFMAKAELFRNPIARWFFTHVGAFSVQRGKGDIGAIDNAVSIVKDGNVMGIFPEGTRYIDGLPPRRAKSGIAVIVSRTGADIIPAAICRKGRFRIFKKTVVRFGKPIKATELHVEDKDRNTLKKATVTITEKITELWELGV